MNREDTDRILSIRCGNCFPAARFVPPFRNGSVSRSPSGYIRTPYPRSLDKNLLIFGKVVGKKAEQTFRYFIEGLAGKDLQDRDDFRWKSRSFDTKSPFQHLIGI